MPDVKEVLHERQAFLVNPPPSLGTILEGEFRKDFFVGVSTIVLKLFHCVNPKVAVFGKKDYQQALIIRSMCNQFNLPVKIVLAETVREIDGLAMSSRNNRLSPTERTESCFLYQKLKELSAQILELNRQKKLNSTKISQLEDAAFQEFKLKKWQPDYFSVRRKIDLDIPSFEYGEGKLNELIILAAASLGKNRLIDNLEIKS